MPFKIYKPVKTPDVEAIRWIGDNWDEIKQFLGDKLIKEDFLFTPPLTEKQRKLISTEYKKFCDSEGRQNVLFKTGYTKDSIDWLYYGDWLYHKIGEPYFQCCSDVFFNRAYKEKD